MFKLFKKKEKEYKADPKRVCMPTNSSQRPVMRCALCKRNYYLDEPAPECVRLVDATPQQLKKIGR